MKRVGFGVLAALLMVVAVGCDNGSSSPVLAPASSTDTFTGTVPVGGADSHTFVVAKDGTVNITLTSVGPPATITMGLGVGTPSGSTCAVSAANAVPAVANASLPFSITLGAGTYCVQLFDIGNQAVDVTYTIIVAHP